MQTAEWRYLCRLMVLIEFERLGLAVGVRAMMLRKGRESKYGQMGLSMKASGF